MNNPFYQNGFLVKFFNALFDGMKLLNLVELPKYVAFKLTTNPTQLKRNQNIAIDLFIISKWLFVSLIYLLDFTSPFWKFTTIYLLITNAYTYFYYHLWNSPKDDFAEENERLQRRYMNLMFAILFSIFGFAVTYHQFYFYDFKFTENTTFYDFLAYSLGNSFGGYSGSIAPNSKITNNTSSLQLFLSFILISGVLSNTSLKPEKRKENNVIPK